MRIKHHVTISLVILFSNFHFGFSDESYNCLNDSDYAYIFAYVDENHTIRLNVTALEPIDKVRLSSSCPQSNFFERFLDKNRKNSIIIPNIYTTLILKQNCPYNVIIHNKNETCHNISYVIPECVDGQCCNIHDPPLRIVHVEPVKTMEDWYNVSLKRTRNFTFFGTNITYHLKHINAEFYDLGMDIHDESLNLTYNSQLIRLNNLIEGEKYEIVLTYYENYTCEASDIFIYTVEKDQSLIVLLLIGTLIVLSWAICCIIKYNKPIFTYLKKLIYNPQPETIEIQDLPLKKSLIPETKFKPNPNYIEHDIYEIEKTYIHIENEIGHGTFGQVCYGKLTKPGEPSIAVAIKKLRNTTEDNCVSFENEIKLMKKIGHHENVVQFMGCCTKTEPYLIVMEFVPGTNLKKYLDDLNKIWKLKEQELSKTRMFFPDNMVIPPQTTYTFYNEERKLSVDMPSPGILSMRPLLDHIQEFQRKNSIDSSPNTVTSYVLTSTPNSAHKSEISETELQDFAVQIAKGMEYLESVNVTHRDLAARNILITPEKQLKISDFGMSRIGNYVLRKSAEIPLKWTSIEGITRGEFTSKNDVWAFAVVLWEIGTLGEDPWGDLTTPSVLEKKLLNGERLQRPDICTEELYELMLKCWSFDPINRPTFKEIVQKINTDQKIYNTMLFHPTHQILEENVEENKNYGNPEVHYKPSLIYPYTSQVKLNSLIEDSRVKFMEKYNLKIPASNGTGLQKYKVLRTLGSGAFGSVFLVKDKSKEASECLALKMQPKERIIKTKQIKHLLSEKAVLAAANFPFIMNMIEAFKDTTYVYFLLPFVNGGDMYTHLKAVGNFSEVVSSFFGSQVLLALEYLHRCNIIYRDLKPENILLDYQGYIKIIDFGFTKFITGRTYSFCGTPEYIAPEIILNKGYGFSTDWWSFGVLIYELTKGKSPFYAREDMEMYENIVRCKYKMPKEFTKDLADLIDKLLQVDISKRFGNLKQGIKDIKTHRWFRHISFGRIYLRSIDPPYKPSVKGPCDTQNFHRHSTDMDMKAPGEHDLYPEEFADF